MAPALAPLDPSGESATGGPQQSALVLSHHSDTRSIAEATNAMQRAMPRLVARIAPRYGFVPAVPGADLREYNDKFSRAVGYAACRPVVRPDLRSQNGQGFWVRSCLCVAVRTASEITPPPAPRARSCGTSSPRARSCARSASGASSAP